MNNWIKTKNSGSFRKFSSSKYIDLNREINRVISKAGGLPTLVSSVNTLSGAVTIGKNEIGLGNVDNTSDLNKPISSATQTALDLKENKYVTINNYTVNTTLGLSDANALVTMSNASSVEIPTNISVAFPIGTQILVTRLGAGAVNITAQPGVTVASAGNLLNLASQYSVACLIKISTDTWLLTGDLS